MSYSISRGTVMEAYNSRLKQALDAMDRNLRLKEMKEAAEYRRYYHAVKGWVKYSQRFWLKHKICAHCGLVLKRDMFPPSTQNMDGYFSYCRRCMREYMRGFSPTSSRKPINRDMENGKKQCPDCRRWLALNARNFFRNKASIDGHSTRCKTCYYQRYHHRKQKNKL